VNNVTYSWNCVIHRGGAGYTFVHVIVYYLNNIGLDKDYCIKPNKPNFKKLRVMGNLLYIIAVILVIAWAIGFFAYSTGGIIHILLVIALIAVIFRVIQGKSIL
jgi:hypothetical protein